MGSTIMPTKRDARDGAMAASREAWARCTSNRFVGGVRDGVMGGIRLGLGLLVLVAADPGMASKCLVSDFVKGKWVVYLPGTFAPSNVSVVAKLL